jgi:hypothetical protein
MDSIEKRIRDRAYYLWEEEGRPHGRDQDHWERARSLLGLETGSLTPSLTTPAEPTEASGRQGQKSAEKARRAVRTGGAKQAAPAAPAVAKSKNGRSSNKAVR